MDQTELDRIRQARIEHLRQDRIENILRQDRLNTPSSSNVSSSTLDTIIPSIDSSDHPSIETNSSPETNVPVNSSSRLKKELDRYFPVNGDNSSASGSGTSTSIEGPVDQTNSSDPASDTTSITVTPASPIEESSSNLSSIERPSSPVGSDDSSETIMPLLYGDPGERPRVALPRKPFD